MSENETNDEKTTTSSSPQPNTKSDESKSEVRVKKSIAWMTRTIAEELDRELFLKHTLIDFLVYALLIVCSIIHGTYHRSHTLFHVHTAMTNHFTRQEFPAKNDRLITFRDIKSAEDVWDYMNFFVDLLYNEFVYDQAVNESVRRATGEETKVLMQNHVLGVARLRQLRVKNDSCEVHPLLRNIFRSCYSRYKESTKSTKKFGPGVGSAWLYNPASKTKSLPFSGYTAHYEGGGYCQDLSTDKAISKQMVQSLKDNFWITRETRAIFLDVSLYNANINTFSVCKLVFEFPHIGGVIPRNNFNSAIFLYSRNLKFKITMVAGIILCCMTIYYLCELIREMVYFKWRILKLFWTYMDAALIVVQFTLAFIVLTRFNLGAKAVQKIKDNPDNYGNLELPCYWYVVYKNCTALQLYFAYIKVFKFLNYNKIMGQLNNTIKRCRMDVFGFSIMFFIVFFAFAELGYLLFGEKSETFKNFPTSMFTLLRTILGDFDYSEIQMANRVMAPIFFITYIFFIFFVLINMFVAIINDSYSDVKTEIAIAPDELQMTEYLKIRFFRLLQRFRCIRRSNVLDILGQEQALTVSKIEEILIKCGFTDLEIETFLLKYLEVSEEGGTTEVILDKLEKELNKEEAYVRTFQSIKPSDYFTHQEKIEQIDHAVEKCTDKLQELLKKMAKLQNVKRTLRSRKMF